MSGTGDKPRPADARGAGRPRYALPSDLAGSLRHPDDGQLNRLLRAVTEEARRRGRPTEDERPRHRVRGRTRRRALCHQAGARRRRSRFRSRRVRPRLFVRRWRPASSRRPSPGSSGSRARRWSNCSASRRAAGADRRRRERFCGRVPRPGPHATLTGASGSHGRPSRPGAERGGDRGNAGGDPNRCVSCRRRQARRPWSGGYR